MCISYPVALSIAEVPNHRVATHYRVVEEFLPGREKVLGKMCNVIDMTLCYLLCVNYFSNYSVFSLYAIDIELQFDDFMLN